MKFISTLALVCLVCSVSAQKQPKPFTFKVEGSVRHFSGKTIYLHHKWDEKDYTDSALVENGIFSFRLQSVDPNMYWFTLSNSITAQPNLIFFADKGTVKVTLIADSLAASPLTAGPTQKDYLEYRALSEKLLSEQQRLQSEYTLAVQKADQDRAKQVQREYIAVSDGYYTTDLKNFVKTHPRSAVSGYIIYREFNNPNVPITLAEECLGYVDKRIENTKFIRLATKRVNDIKGTMMGAIATDFKQATPEGTFVKLSDLRGKYVLVDFWASWCRPCRMENPNVVAAYDKYKEKGFTVFGVSLDSNKEQWVAAIRNDNLSWTNVSDLKGGGNEAAVLFNIQTIPQNLLLDREGRIIGKNLRGPELEAKLQSLFN